MDFKKYKEGDENSIIDLFKRSFNRNISSDYWSWRYRDNPNIIEELINLAWDDNKLVAHYAVSPIQLFIDGFKYNAALSMTTMTDPEYQGRGLFTNLAENLFENSKTLDIIFGVPNENSVKGFIGKLDFKLIKEIPMLESKISKKEYRINSNCVLVEKFDERFDELFKSTINKYKIITSRRSEHLNWRFTNNPENEYKILAYMEDDKLLGYLVTKIYVGSQMITGDIVDILVTNEVVLKELLNFAFSLFQSQNVSSINTWFSDKKLIKIFEEFGFLASGQYFHFIVRDNKYKKNEELFDFDNWYITMSDIDLF